jgi:hypothetical protein
LFSTSVSSKNHITYNPTNPHLESLAADGCVQYFKALNHPKHDAALKQLLLNASDAQEVFNHFIWEWKDEAIDGQGKVLAEDWHNPPAESSFEPSKWQHIQPGEYIDPSNFNGTNTSF